MTLLRYSVMALAISTVLATVCPAGQSLISGACSQVVYIQGCLVYSQRNICSSCEYNYQPSNGLCEYNPKNNNNNCCAKFGSDGACSQCAPGLFLANGACKQTYIPGCLEKSQGVCLNCASDFYLRSGRCVKGVEGCVAYGSDGLCTGCRSPLVNFKNRCVFKRIVGCNNQAADQCSKCYQPFTLVKGVCVLENCLVTFEYGCSSCRQGYFLKQDGTCSANDARVQTYSRGIAISCKSPFKLSNGSCGIQACLNYDPSGLACLNCQSPFKLLNGLCVIPNCLQTHDSKCTICQTGYHIQNGQCVKPLQNCVDSVEEICRECAKGYYLGKDNRCRVNEPGCERYENGVCVRCVQPFVMENGRCGIDGCTEYAEKGCRVCSGSYVLGNGVCRLPFCSVAKSGKCLTCDSNYILRSSSGSCRLRVSTCNYDPNGNCISCTSGYHIFNQSCQKDIQGCTQYSSATTCQTCQNQLYLTNNICKVKLPGCNYNNGVCSSCSAPYVFQNGGCTIEGCEDGGLASTGCLRCQSPYVLGNGNTCRISFCARTANRRCAQCNDGYLPRRDGSCFARIANCQTHNDSTSTCTSCSTNFYLSADTFSCLPSQPGCIYTQGVCSSCRNPFILEANNKCRIFGCSRVSFQGCLECKQPFKLKDFKCAIDNCLAVEASPDRCTQCETGYIVNQTSGGCVRAIPNCQSYEGTLCSKCQSGFYLSRNRDQCPKSQPGCQYTSGECSSCSKPFTLKSNKCIIEGCIQYDFTGCVKCFSNAFILESGVCRLPRCAIIENNKCRMCEKDYLLRKEECVSVDKYCAKYDDFGFCQGCLKGYYLNQQGYCIKELPGSNYLNGAIVSCRTPFTFLPDTKTCVVDGCLQYQDSGCKVCASPYTLQFFNCKLPYCVRSLNGKCLQCEQGFVSWRGVCMKIDPMCVNYNSQGECTGCKDNFMVIDNTCVKKVPGCVYTNGKCSSCYKPFTFINNACVIEGCLKFNFIGCQTCNYPYTLLPSTQTCSIPNCQQTLNGLCSLCVNNYHLEKGLCEVNDPNCLNYFSSGVCSNCVQAFSVLDDGKCHFIDANCRKFNLRSCLECSESYYVNRFNTCSKRLPSCRVYAGGRCTECAEKYYMRNGTTCVPFLIGCTKMQGEKCTACGTTNQNKSTYTLQNGRCVLSVTRLTYNDIDLSSQFQNSNVNGQQIITTDVNTLELLPVSSTAVFIYSSVLPGYTNFNLGYRGARMGWKGAAAVAGDWVGFTLKRPEVFYKVDIEGGENGQGLREFWVEYTLDGVSWKRVDKVFDASASANGLISITFYPLYAVSIRIVVKSFTIWPNFKFQFYISSQSSTTLTLHPAQSQIASFIQGLVSTKTQYQTAANIRGFYSPENMCNATLMAMCWTGMQYCEPKNLTKLILETPSESDQEDAVKSIKSQGTITEYFIDYNLDGSENYACYDGCRKLSGEKKVVVFPKPLLAKSVRVHPTKWTGKPVLRFRFQWN